MDTKWALASFNEQRRLSPELEFAGSQVERSDRVVRVVTPGGGWTGVTWSDLAQADADAVIAAQVERFAVLRRPWEWKHYSYDRPPDLPDRLLAAGFAPEPSESLMIADIADLALDVPPPEGVELIPVVDAAGVAAVVRVHDAVFGGSHSATGAGLLAQLEQRPESVAVVVAMAGKAPIAAGRLERPHGCEFASLWGGGTLARWRGRGVFRSLVAWRAAKAAAAGFRYLQVDATEDSRPILQRLGFVKLATTTPYVYGR